MKKAVETDMLVVFPSELGWMALRTGPSAARQLSFGHPSASAAAASIGGDLPPVRKPLSWQQKLIDLLQAYANGEPVDLSRVPIELDACTDFRRTVLNACRKVAYGRTITYGKLAAKVGAAGAARAVGTCMAQNPLPLIIPCHRVTRAGGVIGPYSGAEGPKTKRRLITMEAANAPAHQREMAEIC